MQALERLGVTGALARLISLIGRSVRDPEVERVLEEYGAEVPRTLGGESDWIELERGTNILADSTSRCRKYPEHIDEHGHVPWMSTLHLDRLTRFEIPFGLTYDMDQGRLEELLGPPSLYSSRMYPRWHVPLIRARGIVLSYYPNSNIIYIQAKWDPESYSFLSLAAQGSHSPPFGRA